MCLYYAIENQDPKVLRNSTTLMYFVTPYLLGDELQFFWWIFCNKLWFINFWFIVKKGILTYSFTLTSTAWLQSRWSFAGTSFTGCSWWGRGHQTLCTSVSTSWENVPGTVSVFWKLPNMTKISEKTHEKKVKHLNPRFFCFTVHSYWTFIVQLPFQLTLQVRTQKILWFKSIVWVIVWDRKNQ